MARQPEVGGYDVNQGDSLLILGLGNLICSDDGVGVAAVDLLQRRYELGPGVRARAGCAGSSRSRWRPFTETDRSGLEQD